MTNEHEEDALKLALTQYSPAFQSWWMKCRPRRLTKEEGKSVLSMYVYITTNIMSRVIFTNIFA
jgi:hypothetical protein